MSQTLLDGTAETVSLAERMDFLRKLEDSQTPAVFFDPQGQKHLIYVNRPSYHRRVNPLDGLDELVIALTCIDASDGLWPLADNLPVGVSVTYTATTKDQTEFRWGPTDAAYEWDWNRGQWM